MTSKVATYLSSRACPPDKTGWAFLRGDDFKATLLQVMGRDLELLWIQLLGHRVMFWQTMDEKVIILELMGRVLAAPAKWR